MDKSIVAKAKDLMWQQTQINKAPSWILTELAVKKGIELAKKYEVNEDVVVTSLYLSHTIFSPIWAGEIQKEHPQLSAEFVKNHLKEWDVEQGTQEIILNSIEAHHDAVPLKSKTAEIVRNAECFKFITVEGSLIWLHELGLRGIPFEESCDKVIKKMEQKLKLLTLADCIEEAMENKKKIYELFSSH